MTKASTFISKTRHVYVHMNIYIYITFIKRIPEKIKCEKDHYTPPFPRVQDT